MQRTVLCFDLATDIIQQRLGSFLTQSVTPSETNSFASSFPVNGKQFVHPGHNRRLLASDSPRISMRWAFSTKRSRMPCGRGLRRVGVSLFLAGQNPGMGWA